MFNGRGDRVPGVEWRVHNDAKALNLEIGLVQGLKETSIIKVMVKRYGEVGIHDGSDKGGVFSGRWEQVELMAVDRDVDRQDRGNFYSSWRRNTSYG